MNPNAMPATDTDLERAVLEVRMNRCRPLWAIIICLPLSCAVGFLLPGSDDPVIQAIGGMVLGVPAGLAGGSIALLMRNTYLTYDPRSRTIRGPSRWRLRMTYPRTGYERIEYSVYDGRIYEVRADGKRRKLMFTRWIADQRDWRALVDLMLEPEVRSPAEPTPPLQERVK
jgi:CRISPR/Cas system-associated endoribonuclease Cas2